MRNSLSSSPHDPSGSDFGREAAHWVEQRSLLRSFDLLLVGKLHRHLGQRLLEIGCGAGNMTQFLLDRELIVAVDSHLENVLRVRARFTQHANFVCLPLDITVYDQSLDGFEFDSALCTNVLEHIPDDELALRKIAKVLPTGGTLVVLVPASPYLYCSLDVAAGHFRRYSTRELLTKVRRAGFTERKLYRINAIGALGWFVNGKLARRSVIPDWQIRLFDAVANSLMAIEARLPISSGLSIVVVCVKN